MVTMIDEEIQPSDPESREEPSLNGNEDSSVEGVKQAGKFVEPTTDAGLEPHPFLSPQYLCRFDAQREI